MGNWVLNKDVPFPQVKYCRKVFEEKVLIVLYGMEKSLKIIFQ